MNNNLERAKIYEEVKKKALASIDICYHPFCKEKSINSHILQENGILSEIAEDRHLWTILINKFQSPEISFKRKGISKAFSFNCFCNKHDRELFKKIETKGFDLSDYESCLLFTLRTLYNEIFRKEVNLIVYGNLKYKSHYRLDVTDLNAKIHHETLGLEDLKLIEKEIWRDLNSGSESYVFKNRLISKIEICLSSFYTYDTTAEMQNYIRKYNKEMERVSHIFISCFPQYENSILLMGYHKTDDNKVKGYFNTFFKEREKRLFRKLTNLVLFNCENWVVSDKFYEEKLKGIEDIYNKSVKIQWENVNERKEFDFNFMQNDFIKKFRSWCEKY